MPLLDWHMLAWTSSLWVVSDLAATSRPMGFLAHVVVILTLVFGIFLFIPMRYMHRLICATAGVTGYLACLGGFGHLLAADAVPMTLAFTVATLVGAATCFRLERLRRVEFRHLEEMRVAKQAAEAANEAKSRFLAAVSHELRTPMNGVLGLLQLLEGGPLDQVQRGHVETAEAAAGTLITLLDEILDFIQLEAEQPSLELAPFDLRRLVESTTALLRARAEAKGLSLTLAIEPPHPLPLLGDANRLRQLLHNLIGNAIKFTAEGGVAVSIELLPLGEDRFELRAAVSDTCIGIAPDMLGRIFDEFVQGDATIARRFGGTGLGLAICRKILDMMGGEIAVESRPGQGSAFRCHLPLAAAPPQPVTAPLPAGAGRRLRVLVVEDDAVNRLIAAGLLDQLGHRATLADHGEQALVLAAQENFDAILMDLHLPGLDGIEVARRIRALPHAGRAAVPILALTADVTSDSRRRCAEAGMRTVIAKPLLRANLAAALEALGQGRRDEDEPARVLPVPAPAPVLELVDRAFVAEQCAMLDPAKLAPLVRLFHRTSLEALEALGAAAQAGDREMVAQLAHRLRTACGALGSARLRAMASAIEAGAQSLELPALEAAIADLAPARKASLDELIAIVRDAIVNGASAVPDRQLPSTSTASR